MEGKKLVKEIITTETEKFTEEGKIKERVKETREKIYSNGYSKKDLDKAKVAEKEVPKDHPKEVVQTDEELIKAAAEKIDKEYKEEEAPKQQIVETPPQPQAPVPNPYQAYIQAQTPVQAGQAAPKFPWEKA